MPPVHRDALVELAHQLRSLHHQKRPLVLPNAWDVGSAQAVERAGASAIATTSSGVAAAFGMNDGEVPAHEMFLMLLRIAGAVRVPVTADLEAGYGMSPEALVEEMLRAGAVGINLEDTDWQAAGPALADAAAHAAHIAAVREASRVEGVPIVINARVDVFLRREGEPRELLDDATARAVAYMEAGADCVYPIGLGEPGAIGRFVRRVNGPVNILLRPGSPSLAQLRRLGVRRISVGGGLWRQAQAMTESVARRLLSGDGGPFAEIGEA